MTSRSLLHIFTVPSLTRKLLWLLIIATLIIISLIIVPKIPTQYPSIDSKIMAAQILLWILFMVSAVSFRTLAATRWTFTDTVFAFLILAYSFSTLFSGRIGFSLATNWQQGGLIVLSWIVYRLRPTYAECRALAWVIAGLGIVCSLYGILTYIGKDILRPLYPFAYDKEQGGRNFIHSFFGNPEYFAGFAAPTAIISLGLAFQPRATIYKRILWLAATGFILLTIVLSSSRSALMGFTVGAGVQFLGQVTHMERKLKRLAWISALLAIIIFIAGVIILSTPNPLNRRDTRLIQRFTEIADTRSESVRERILFFTSTANAIPENPVFGYGPGTYRLEFLNNIKKLVENDSSGISTAMLNDLNRRLAEHAHNDYLEIWFDQGTLGFGAFMLLIIHAAIRFVSTGWLLARSKIGRLSSAATIHASLYAAFLTMTLNALTSFPFQMPARSTLAWILVGTFFALDATLGKSVSEISKSAPEHQAST